MAGEALRARAAELVRKVDEGEKELAKKDLESFNSVQRALFVEYSALWNDAEAAGAPEVLATLKELRPKLKVKIPGKSKGIALVSAVARLLLTMSIISYGAFCVFLLGPLRLLHPLLRSIGVRNGLLPFDIVIGLFFRVVMAAMGVKVRVEHGSLSQWGAAPCGVIVYNHASNLDPFIINAVTHLLGTKYVGKESVLKIPLFGWLGLMSGMVPIKRGDREKAQATMNETVRDLMKNFGRCVSISPEGTRSTDGHLLLPFKKGVFHLQERTRAPFLPIVIHNSFDLWPPKLIFTRQGELRVSILPPQCIEESMVMEPDGSYTYKREDARVRLQRLYSEHLAAHTDWRPEPLSPLGLAQNGAWLLAFAILSPQFYRVYAAIFSLFGLGLPGVGALVVVITIAICLYVDYVV